LPIPPLAASDGPPEGCSVTHITVRVRFGETDLMAIVHHANYLLYFEEARVEYLLRRGAVYSEWITRGMHFPVIDQRIAYRAPALFHDVLDIEVWIGAHTRVTVRFDYRAHRDGVVLAEGYTTLACVDDARRPRRIPPEILQQILGPEASYQGQAVLAGKQTP
jgi:acyl-CoA thioester hydrolase